MLHDVSQGTGTCETKKEHDRKKRETEEKLRLERELRVAKRHTKLRNECAKLHRAHCSVRAHMAGLTVQDFVKSVRSMKERRAIVKMRVLTKGRAHS